MTRIRPLYLSHTCIILKNDGPNYREVSGRVHHTVSCSYLPKWLILAVGALELAPAPDLTYLEYKSYLIIQTTSVPTNVHRLSPPGGGWQRPYTHALDSQLQNE